MSKEKMRAAELLARLRRQQQDDAARRLAALEQRQQQCARQAQAQAERMTALEADYRTRFSVGQSLDIAALSQAQQALGFAAMARDRAETEVRRADAESHRARDHLSVRVRESRLAENWQSGVLASHRSDLASREYIEARDAENAQRNRHDGRR